MSNLIRVYEIPLNVRKQYSKFTALELYDDKMVGKGSLNGDITWFFKNYMTVQWTPASVATQFANLVFTTTEGASQLIQVNNLNQATDINRIMFCSGMFSYAAANDYVRNLYLDVKKVFDEYKSKESEIGMGNTFVQEVSAADELKKFKELLDMGVITQEEFDTKKKQLLGIGGGYPSNPPAQSSQTTVSAPVAPPAPRMYLCPTCRGSVGYGEPRCRYCGALFNWG